MKCVICKHCETYPDNVTVTLQRGESTIIFKNVPAKVRENCGEYYLSDEITGQLIARTEEALQHGAEVEIVRFTA
jgi:YgiT-type zinc finger domain-containing protein